MKLILHCEPEEISEVSALIQRVRLDFELTRTKIGWGWTYRIPSGREFFLRRLKDGISATPVEDSRL